MGAGPHVEKVSVLPSASDNPDRIVELAGELWRSNGLIWVKVGSGLSATAAKESHIDLVAPGNEFTVSA